MYMTNAHKPGNLEGRDRPQSEKPPATSSGASSPASSSPSAPPSDQVASKAFATKRGLRKVVAASSSRSYMPRIVVTDEMKDIGSALLSRWDRDDLDNVSSRTFVGLLFRRMAARMPSPEGMENFPKAKTRATGRKAR